MEMEVARLDLQSTPPNVYIGGINLEFFIDSLDKEVIINSLEVDSFPELNLPPEIKVKTLQIELQRNKISLRNLNFVYNNFRLEFHDEYEVIIYFQNEEEILHLLNSIFHENVSFLFEEMKKNMRNYLSIKDGKVIAIYKSFDEYKKSQNITLD